MMMRMTVDEHKKKGIFMEEDYYIYRRVSTHSNIEDRRDQYGGIAIPIRVGKGCHKQWQHGGKATPAVDRFGRRRVAHLHNICEISH